MSSTHDFVDLMIAINGKFRYFEDDHGNSSDNSSYPNLKEIEKRNKYLEFAADKNIEFLLLIDPDEFALVNQVKFLFNLDKYSIQ